MFSWAYLRERQQYQRLKRVEFNAKNFSNDPQTNVINDQGLMQYIERIEEIILAANDEYHRNGNQINEAQFIQNIRIPLGRIVTVLRTIINNPYKNVDHYEISNNKYTKVCFQEDPDCDIDIDQCIKAGVTGHDFNNYICGHKRLLSNELMPSLRSNRTAYERSANASIFWNWWRWITFAYYRGRMSTYVSRYEEMIDTVQLLQQEIQSYYNKVNDIYKQIKKAYDLLNEDNPNLITFTSRYLAFLDKCGKNGEPLIQTLAVQDLTEFKDLLKNWYDSQGK